MSQPSIGNQGPQGSPGGGAFQVTLWTLRPATNIGDTDPLRGTLKFREEGGSIRISVSSVNSLGDDVTGWVESVLEAHAGMSTVAVVTNADDPGAYRKGIVTAASGPTTSDGVDSIVIDFTVQDSSGSFSDGDTCRLLVTPRGRTGPQGYQGSQGVQGLPGGPQGSQGAKGLKGSQGYQGANGDSGHDGTSGTQGQQGAQGSSTGPQGTQGPQGPQGPQGTQGAPGPQGYQGPQGGLGPQGAQGPQGPQGPQGSQGQQGDPGGPQGDIGDTGPQGYQGFQGASMGPQGHQGNAGVAGDQGHQGVQGPQGVQGDQGTQGFQGLIGFVGSTGGIGPQGAQGAQGSQGVQGDRGTQGQQGDVGAQGDQGAQGTQGYQGVQGSVGAQGPQGMQGFQGYQGPAGGGGAVARPSLDANHIHVYNCDDASGVASLADSGSGNRSAILYGTAGTDYTIGVSYQAGRTVPALRSLKAANASINSVAATPDTCNIAGNQLTLECVLLFGDNLSSYENQNILAAKNTATTQYSRIYMTSYGAFRYELYVGGQWYYTSWCATYNNVPNVNRLMHVMGVYDGSGATAHGQRMKLYINGYLISTDSSNPCGGSYVGSYVENGRSPSSSVTLSQVLFAGWRDGSNISPQCHIRDVRISNTARSEAYAIQTSEALLSL